jgi:hypothetical protein
VAVNQDLTEGVVYGTDARPLKRTVGQLSIGAGQLVFSDMGEAFDFFAALGDQPFMAIWACDYTLAKADGSFKSVELRSCRLLGMGLDHSAGSEALGATYPFSFMQMRVDGRDLVLSPKAIVQAALGIAQNLTNLL